MRLSSPTDAQASRRQCHPAMSPAPSNASATGQDSCHGGHRPPRHHLVLADCQLSPFRVAQLRPRCPEPDRAERKAHQRDGPLVRGHVAEVLPGRTEHVQGAGQFFCSCTCSITCLTRAQLPHPTKADTPHHPPCRNPSRTTIIQP